MTTSLVLAELGNSLARTVLREEVAWLIRQMYGDPAATVVHTDQGLFEEGVELYQSHADKVWGLVDCISFVVMRKMQLVDVFTADQHFAQAGYSCLLRSLRSR